MTDATFEATATGSGLMDFLTFAIEKGHVNASTGQAMKSAVKEVLASTETKDGWESVNLDELDLDDTLRRFETLRAMKYSSGSLRTYKQRFQKSIKMYEEFRASPGTWRPDVAPRQRPKVLVKKVARGGAPSGAVSSSREGRTAKSPEPRSSASAAQSHRNAAVTYPFPLREGTLATVELPADLSVREAERLAAFIRSLAIEDPSDGRPAEASHGHNPE